MIYPYAHYVIEHIVRNSRYNHMSNLKTCISLTITVSAVLLYYLWCGKPYRITDSCRYPYNVYYILVINWVIITPKWLFAI